MICSIFGHRIIEDDIDVNFLSSVFRRLIEKGYNEFYFGGFGDFDKLCHKIISDLKKSFPQIKRTYCLSDERHLRPIKRPNYLSEKDYEEFVFLPLDFYGWYKRIYFRNCAMVDNSNYIVFYVKKRENIGAYKTYAYAKQKKKNFFNICENKKTI